MGLEPTRIAPYVPETYAYTNSATAANKTIIRKLCVIVKDFNFKIKYYKANVMSKIKNHK